MPETQKIAVQDGGHPHFWKVSYHHFPIDVRIKILRDLWLNPPSVLQKLVECAPVLYFRLALYGARVEWSEVGRTLPALEVGVPSARARNPATPSSCGKWEATACSPYLLHTEREDAACPLWSSNFGTTVSLWTGIISFSTTKYSKHLQLEKFCRKNISTKGEMDRWS